jgi:hypothetical protein
MLPDDLSLLLNMPTPHLKEQLGRNQHALENFLQQRYLPDSDLPQPWIDDLRTLIEAIQAELERREN